MKKECKHGHVLDAFTSFVNKKGSLICRVCARAAWRKWSAKQPKAVKVKS